MSLDLSSTCRYILFMDVNRSAPRNAATVVVVRDGQSGLEVLLLQRAERGDHNSGAWVFPGGLVDPQDAQVSAPAMSDAQASSRLDVAGGGLAFYVAAIRECFEEAGILFALDARGEIASLAGALGDALAALRDAVGTGACPLADVLRQFELTLAPERLHYIGHWLTPLGRAKRFDTRFFLAIAPQRQLAMHDANETLDHVWLAPAEALSPANSRRLMTPTRAMLDLLLPFRDTSELAAWAASPRRVDRVLPRLALGAQGLQPVLPGHPAYDEVGKLDAEGRCDAWCELRPGVPVRIGEHVVRIAGATGNRYLVETPEGEVSVDPQREPAPCLVAGDRIVIVRDTASLTPQLREDADWLAPAEGFLISLR